MSQREQLKELLQARQEIRSAKKAVNQTRAAYNAARGELTQATAKAEKVLVEIEQKQGILPLNEGEEQPAVGS